MRNKTSTSVLQRVGMRFMVVLLVFGAPAIAQAAEASLDVDTTSLTTDEVLTLKLSLSGRYDSYTPLLSDGFTFKTVSQSSQMSIINGRMTKSKQLILQGTPTKPGLWTLGPVQLLFKGKVVGKTESVTVKVSPGVADVPLSQEEAKSLEKKKGKPYFLQPILPDRPLYQGEPFLFALDLYLRNDVNVQSASEPSFPELPGFVVEDLMPSKGKVRPRTVTIGGITYSSYRQVHMLLVPLEAKETKVGSVSLSLVVGDFFSARQVKVTSPPIVLDVKPVPTKGRPASFQDGNIGSFTMTASLSSPKAKVGEKIIATVILEGSGNIEGLKEPITPEAKSFELALLPGGVETTIDKGIKGVVGSKTYQYLVTPLQDGAVVVPPFTFTYFDPEEGAFVTATTKPMALDVSVGAAVEGGTISGKKVALPDVRPLAESSSFQPVSEHRPAQALWFRLLLAIALGLLAASEVAHLFRRLRNRDPARVRQREAKLVARDELAACQRRIKSGERKDAMGSVVQALVKYLSMRYDTELKGLGRSDTIRLLRAKGLAEHMVDEIVQVLDECDFARFTPQGQGADDASLMVGKAEELIARLERLP